MKRSVTLTLCATVLLGSVAHAADAPAKAAPAAAKQTVDPSTIKGFTAGPFTRYEKLLTPATIVPIKQYYDSLKGAEKRGFLVLARGILRVANRFQWVLNKAGKSGLDIETLFVRVARNVVAALAERKYKSGDGATRWVFARLRNLSERLRAVLNESGAGGTGFVKLIEGSFTKLKARVRDISKGTKKWVPGKASAAMKGFRTQLTAAYKKVVAKLKPGLKAAKESFANYLDGYVELISKPKTVLFGRFAPEYTAVEKDVRAWFEKLKKGAEQSAHRVLVKGLGSIIVDGKVAIAQNASKGAGIAYQGIAGMLAQIVGAGAKKGLTLAKGLDKFITDSIAKFPAAFDKALAAKKAGSPEFAKFIKGAFTAAVKAVIAKSKEVLSGKQKAGPGKVTFWFKKAIADIGKAFPKKVNDAAFAAMIKDKAPPKDLTDFVASLAK